jgi:glycosyltransferase involved in cell wall biosynthesis
MSGRVSVLIPALNEARNIGACVESARWADEVVVVDSGSQDGTAELARERGAGVVRFQWNGAWPKKKNWALANVAWKGDWVLVLDADERVPAELAREIRSELERPRAEGYFINRRFMFLGQWLRHCGYYPSWNLRLFRRELGRYERLVDGDTGSGDNEVHEHVVLQGRTGRLQGELLHLAYPDIATWMEKHNRYSNWEARVEVLGASGGARGCGGVAARRRLREWSRRLPFRPSLRFIYSYLLRGGFLDGYAGYVFCRLLATYEMMSVFKAHELRARRRGDG